jgi:hypothetical protein
MKETITRCAICKKENCDGKEWIIKKTPVGEIKVCSSQTYIKDDKRYYRYVMGHGCEWDIELSDN